MSDSEDGHDDFGEVDKKDARAAMKQKDYGEDAGA